MLCNSQSKWSWTFLRPGWARSWDNENYIVKDAFVVIVGCTNIEHNIQTLNLWIYVRIKMILQIHLKFLELNCWYFFSFKMHENSIYLPIRKVVNLERFTGVEIMTMWLHTLKNNLVEQLNLRCIKTLFLLNFKKKTKNILQWIRQGDACNKT